MTNDQRRAYLMGAAAATEGLQIKVLGEGISPRVAFLESHAYLTALERWVSDCEAAGHDVPPPHARITVTEVRP